VFVGIVEKASPDPLIEMPEWKCALDLRMGEEYFECLSE